LNITCPKHPKEIIHALSFLTELKKRKPATKDKRNRRRKFNTTGWYWCMKCKRPYLPKIVRFNTVKKVSITMVKD